MPINKKFMVIAGFAGVVAVSIAASMPQQQEPPKPKNLKVLPKDIPFRTLDHIMDTWAVSLGVHCNFCHARDPQTNKMDFASDAKPEKTTARHMFKMAAKINKKFFEGQKDSLGMVAGSINCYTCHRGQAHPEVKLPERQRGPGGPPPGNMPPPPPGSTPPGQ
ncbi:MAG: c-type cytochrome [Bacteroidetes bacterium]|nr:c-type cytochrome [Bacteroidota bacterium]